MSFVRDRNAQYIVLDSRNDAYLRAIGRVFDGVAHDILDGPVNQFAIDLGHEGRCPVMIDRGAAGVRFESRICNDVIKNINDIKCLHLKPVLRLICGAGQREDLSDETVDLAK